MTFEEQFKPFLNRRGQLKIVYLATCNEAGQPNCAPRLVVDIVEPNYIYLIDFEASQTHVNIRHTKTASLAFMDERRLMSFKIGGTAEIINAGQEFDSLQATWTKIANAYHAERIIERIKGIVSGRAKELLPRVDHVFVKFTAEAMKKSAELLPSMYPIGKIASLQLRIDELEDSAEQHRQREVRMKVSRDSYKAQSAMFESAAMEDSLTGLYNRRGFITLTEQQLKIARRQKKNCVFLFFDVDHLKRINDTSGHAKGDQALADVAHILTRSFRESDIVARIGGDEFAVAMVDCDKSHVELAQDRFRTQLAEHNRTSAEAAPLELSVGVATCIPSDTFSLSDLLNQSDQMMYAEKRTKT